MALVDPYQCDERTLGDSRLLFVPFPFLGTRLQDPDHRGRVWTVNDAFAMDPSLPWEGLRFRCIDGKGFVSFVSQRDLEVAMGHASPGSPVGWYPQEVYYGTISSHWKGFRMTVTDREDDLFLRECILRMDLGRELSNGMTLERLLHLNEGVDVKETHIYAGSGGYRGAHPSSREEVANRWNRGANVQVSWG